jgi:carbon storage regulator
MLVLTRKVGEIIVIGDNIEVKVVDLRGGQVRIGIKAPDGIMISRGEKLKEP